MITIIIDVAIPRAHVQLVPSNLESGSCIRKAICIKIVYLIHNGNCFIKVKIPFSNKNNSSFIFKVIYISHLDLYFITEFYDTLVLDMNIYVIYGFRCLVFLPGRKLLSGSIWSPVTSNQESNLWSILLYLFHAGKYIAHLSRSKIETLYWSFVSFKMNLGWWTSSWREK